MQDMTPQPEDTSVTLPITFDYRGGRGQNTKSKVITTIAIVVITLIVCIGLARNADMEIYLKAICIVAVAYVGLFLLRYIIFKEQYFSDIYETLKEKDYVLDTTDIWQIFDIDFDYPYICYFKNGKKGIFVKMEKDAITGKASEAQYDHYEAISDAYNIAHSLNMDLVHIDYMDNVGNDPRLQKMYDDLNDVSNPDMQDMLIDIYTNLQDEMSGNYSSFDIYLFLTRDKAQNFLYNVQAVTSAMLGGNFITYKILNRQEISGVCTALFNLHDFSIVDACENVLSKTQHRGIIPIKVTHSDGTVEEINKTMAEKNAIAREQERKKQEQLAEMERQKRIRKQKKKGTYVETKIINNDDLDLFDIDTDEGVEVKLEGKKPTDTEEKGIKTNLDNSDDLNLF
jgi:hypothetical protein